MASQSQRRQENHTDPQQHPSAVSLLGAEKLDTALTGSRVAWSPGINLRSCSLALSARFSSPPQDVLGILAFILLLIELSGAPVVTVS